MIIGEVSLLTNRPWGAVNMSFYDPDNNLIYLRQFSEEL